MVNTLTHLARRFASLSVLVIGDAMLDTYIEGTATRLCREGPAPVVSKTAERRAPGGAANVAANLRALGADVRFVSVVGADPTGANLRAALRACDVADEWLIAQDTAPTLHKMRILADGQYVARVDEGGVAVYAPDCQRELLARVTAAAQQCDLIFVSDYGYGVVSDELIAHLRELRSTQPVPLVVDSKRLHRFRAAGATIVTPNHFEARELLASLGGATPDPDDTPSAGGAALVSQGHELARRLLGALDADHAAVTLAGAGVCVASRSGAGFHIPARPVAQANDVGAGDSFAAGLALALAAGGAVADATRIGVEVAGLAVAKRWTSVVTRREVLQRVSHREQVDLTDDDGQTNGDGAVSAQRARLRERLERARRQGKTIVFTNGVFDILHAGHVQFLRQAKALGDVLVVGVNSDRSLRRLATRRIAELQDGAVGVGGVAEEAPSAIGSGDAINDERDRLALVAALDPVDFALLFDEATPAETIRTLRPHIHVKGGDYEGAALPEADAAREVGAQIVVTPLGADLTTEALFERILAQATQAVRRAPMTETRMESEAVG